MSKEYIRRRDIVDIAHSVFITPASHPHTVIKTMSPLGPEAHVDTDTHINTMTWPVLGTRQSEKFIYKSCFTY